MEATETIIVKAALGPDEMILLNREAEFYSNELRHLQGTVVPKCFGLFRGKVDGVDFGCLLLEYCSGRAPVWNMLEFRFVLVILIPTISSLLIHDIADVSCCRSVKSIKLALSTEICLTGTTL
jgi:hypothetical protein